MAGIEKICEFSGTFDPALKSMYEIKRNNIQVLPGYRKLFKGQEHIMFLFERRPANEEHADWTMFNTRRPEFEFCLYVPGVPGQVSGFYWNYSSDFGTVKRKLKRLLKTRSLNIIRLPFVIDTAWDAMKHKVIVNDINQFLLLSINLSPEQLWIIKAKTDIFLLDE